MENVEEMCFEGFEDFLKVLFKRGYSKPYDNVYVGYIDTPISNAVVQIDYYTDVRDYMEVYVADLYEGEKREKPNEILYYILGILENFYSNRNYIVTMPDYQKKRCMNVEFGLND